MAKRGRPPEGIVTSSVRLHRDLVKKLRIISSIRNITSAKLLEPVLRPFVEAEYMKALKEAPGSR